MPARKLRSKTKPARSSSRPALRSTKPRRVPKAKAVPKVASPGKRSHRPAVPPVAPAPVTPPAPPERKPRSPSLHESVRARVRDMITTGELEPGVRITERILTAKLHVSRTPLREALKVLAHEGLVELLPNCGARVTKLTEDDARHLFEVIEALESQAGRLACERITAAELAELKSVHHEMHAYFLRRELPAYFRLNQTIHERIVDAARNPLLSAAHAAHSARIRRARYKEIQVSEERWRAAMAEHEQMIDALTQRDAEQLGELLKFHLHQMFEAAYHSIAVERARVAA